MATPNDHFDGRRFFNPTGPTLQPVSALPRMLSETRAPWPSWIDVAPTRPPALGDDAAVVTFIGHSTFLIRTAAGNILTDPMYSDRAGPWNITGPRRVRPPAVRFDDLPPIAVVLLSHNHYDHCDLRTLRRLAQRFDPIVVTPLGNAALVRSAGIRRVEELDWWEDAKSPPMPVILTRAHHFAARGLFDRFRALWGGFLVSVGDRWIYFAGDTAYAPFFADVRRRVPSIALALLPIGAYEPRWFMQSVHMNPDEAVRAHLELEAVESIAMHFGTFQLTTEAIDEPVQALARALEDRRLPPACFRALAFGESTRL
jgi:L-ascorbate metabolism protein UlaG (beta-lactamase superfamily)